MVGSGILPFIGILFSSEMFEMYCRKGNVWDLKCLYSECPLSEALLYVEGDVMVAYLVWQHSLAHRIHCMWYGDLTHDGLSELAVVSTGGIHILQVSRLQTSQCQLQLNFTKSPVHSLQNFHTLLRTQPIFCHISCSTLVIIYEDLCY